MEPMGAPKIFDWMHSTPAIMHGPRMFDLKIMDALEMFETPKLFVLRIMGAIKMFESVPMDAPKMFDSRIMNAFRSLNRYS